MTQDLDAAALPSESTVSQPSASAAAAATVSVGQALKNLRVAKGWSLEDISSRIKFSARLIQALEDEQWDKLPKGVSLRGLVRSYARLLETDPAAIVSSIESQVGALNAPGAVHRISRTTPVAVSGHAESRGGAPWGWLLIIVVLLVVLAGYALWQDWLPADWLPSWLSGQTP